MRINALFLIFVVLFSCKESTKSNKGAIVKSDIEEVEEVKKTEQIETVENDKKQFPEWLQLINTEKSKAFGGYGNYSIAKYNKLNDSISYAIFEFRDGVCLIDSLAIFKNEKEVGIKEICGQCDHDLSNPEHEWSEFKFQDPKTIKLTSYREYVHDSLIAENGSIKEQYDFLEAPTKIDTVTTFLEIGDNGTIYKQEGMVINKFTTSLFADFFQFYLQDERASGDLSNAWTEVAVTRMLALSSGTIGVGTVRNMDVMVSLKVFDKAPNLLEASNTIHQINECDLEMLSENLVIAGCTDYFPEAKRIKIGKGLFRVRIYYKDLDKINEDGLEGEDTYEIHIWPITEKRGLRIVKSRGEVLK